MNRAELIEALEKAEGPDREFDGAIRHVMIGDFAYCDADTGHTCAKYPECSEGYGCGVEWGMCDERRSYPWDWRDDDRLPAYTSSIDTALTLVPDGWTLAGLGFDDNNRWFCELREGFQTSYANVIIVHLKSDKQPAAIALCIAALKAMEQSDE